LLYYYKSTNTDTCRITLAQYNLALLLQKQAAAAEAGEGAGGGGGESVGRGGGGGGMVEAAALLQQAVQLLHQAAANGHAKAVLALQTAHADMG